MSTEYKGKVYVLHIKHSSDRDWESDDLVYAIANDGGKGFSYSDFKRACFLNKGFFLAKKAGKDEKKCYWKDIEDAMQLEPAVGSPKLVHVSSVISFLDLAHMLYTDGYFDNKEIYEIINEREKNLNPKIKPSKSASKRKEVDQEPRLDLQEMVERARIDGENF